MRRLREAGAILLGKTNMHELARGITTVSSIAGQTRNPYDPTRNPGGSSGGTGAAVAASFAAVGMGSDTCGSIRIPSAHHALIGAPRHPGTGQRRRHHPAFHHPGHRRTARALGPGSGDHARRHGRLRPGGRYHRPRRGPDTGNLRRRARSEGARGAPGSRCSRNCSVTPAPTSRFGPSSRRRSTR